ncbi:MAG: hypothetical protein K2Y23_17700 [Cyanobacteria bacterium]|nr:hypothetical protein [Cyanobacteriota bacterium]
MASLFSARNVILAAVATYALVVGAAFLERRASGVDIDALVAAVIATSNAPPDRAAAMETFVRPMMANYPIVIVLGLAVGWPFLTTVFFLVFKLVDAGLTWGTVFAATVWASLAQAVAGVILRLVLSMSRQPTATEIVQQTFVNANVGAFLSPESAPWLLALGRSLDALTILYLMVFAALLGGSGRSKASDNAIATAVGISFALWIVVRVGWAFAFGR